MIGLPTLDRVAGKGAVDSILVTYCTANLWVLEGLKVLEEHGGIVGPGVSNKLASLVQKSFPLSGYHTEKLQCSGVLPSVHISQQDLRPLDSSLFFGGSTVGVARPNSVAARYLPPFCWW